MAETITLKPDYIGALSMDRELGKRLKPGQVIDFDYDAYYETARAMGASDEEIANIEIDIVDPSRYPRRKAGTYYPPEDDQPALIEVVFTRRRRQEINHTLVHETQHFIDDSNGKLENVDSKAYQRGVEAISHFYRLAALQGLGTIAIAGGLWKEVYIATGIGSLMTLWSGAKIRRADDYFNDPAEKRARVAEEKFGNSSIISISSK